jgi:hypothetical protein
LNKKVATLILTAVFVTLIVVVAVNFNLSHTKSDDARHHLFAISTALERYNSDFNHYPSNEDGLSVLIRPGDNGRYFVDKTFLLDPWRNPIIYKTTVENSRSIYKLKSFGPNEMDDGGRKDDIVLEGPQ